MRTYLLYCVLLIQSVLAAQPELTLDYYFQEGLHPFNWINIDSSKLEIKGTNVIWDFSKEKMVNSAFSYRLENLPPSFFSYYPNFKGTEKRLIISNGYDLDFDYLDLDFESPIIKVAEGGIYCDAIGTVSRIFINSELAFPAGLLYQDTIRDTSSYMVYTATNPDTILTFFTFIYDGYGRFIHPNKDTFCDVIKIITIKETYFGKEKIETWYSKKAKGAIAISNSHFYNGENPNQIRIEIKNLDFVNISDNVSSQDSTWIAHTIHNCTFNIALFSDNSCSNSFDYDRCLIDFDNDGIIDDTSFAFIPESHQQPFKIGTHRIIYQKNSDSGNAEKILIITDKQSPSIGGYCDGNGYYLKIPKDSSSILITPSDLYTGVSDNNCKDSLIFRLWFYEMEEEAIPNPNSLTPEQILDLLPDSYRIYCLKNPMPNYSGFIYAFDKAGNWSRRGVSLRVQSEGCIYSCPSNQFTQISIKDLQGNIIKNVESPPYLKQLEYSDDIYKIRKCPEDSSGVKIELYNLSNIREGVTIFDLILIKKHILGLKPFSSFQQFAAADVNFSGNITTIDLVIIKQAILGKRDNFPNISNYVFFEDEENLLEKRPSLDVLPINLQENKTFELEDTTYHFIGIKLGDVSGG